MSNVEQPAASILRQIAQPPVSSQVAQSNRAVRFNTWAVVFVALTLVSAVAFFSPNFDATQHSRTEPFGGDLVQEWVGGHIVLSGEADSLYQLEPFKNLQHDAQLLGFEWASNKYFPAVYPPFYYALVSPLAMVSYSTAVWIWLMIAGLCLAGIGAVSSRIAGQHSTGFAMICMIAAAIFTPTLICITTSQKSLVLLLMLGLSYQLLRDNRNFLAGMAFGAIAFKPHLVVLIAVAMLLKGQWRFVSGTLLSVAVFAGTSLALSLQASQDFSQLAQSVLSYIQSGGYDLMQAHSLLGAMQLLLGGFGQPVVLAATAMVGAAVLVMLAMILRGKLEPGSTKFAFQFGALVLGTVLLSPHFYIYDLTIVLLPIFLVFVFGRQSTFRTPMLLLQMFCITFLFLAGSFAMIANLVPVQPSVVLMLAMLVTITVILGKSGGTEPHPETSLT